MNRHRLLCLVLVLVCLPVGFLAACGADDVGEDKPDDDTTSTLTKGVKLVDDGAMREGVSCYEWGGGTLLVLWDQGYRGAMAGSIMFVPDVKRC